MAASTPTFDLETARREAADSSVLLYAGTCPKCRWMARTVIWLSAGGITGVSLAEPQWRRLYDDELPESRGSPILIRRGQLIWGWRLFVLTPFLALGDAIRRRR